eukprot:TRINITY_DN20991_c0_g1_i1.p1 TRINITY_DN20991_c0_g1~~TRINITY_DN20991_c0_g1_i1.p1  ORF type:complete len:418 (+),score=36.66 TRINITY_DN20991_c0_g1_i1:190-1443(+)
MSRRGPQLCVDILNKPTVINSGQRHLTVQHQEDVKIARLISGITSGIRRKKNTAFSLIGKKQMTVDVMALYKVQHNKPDFSYHTTKAALEAFSKLTAVKSAEFIIKNMPTRPDVTLYTFLMATYCNADLHDKVQTVFSTMLSDGYSPSRKAFTYLLKSYSHQRNITKCKSILKQMSSMGIVPDKFHILDTACCFTLYTEMTQFFEEAKQQYGLRIAPILRLNYILKTTLALSEKMTLYEGARKDPACKPVNSTYTFIITELRKAGRYSEALNIFENDLVIDNCKPDLVTCGAYMSTCYAAMHSASDQKIFVAKAETCFSDLHRSGELAEYSLILILMDIYERGGCTERAKLLKQFVINRRFGKVPMRLRTTFKNITGEEWTDSESKDRIQHIGRFYKPEPRSATRNLKDEILEIMKQ